MRARIISLLLTTAFLSACSGDMENSDNENQNKTNKKTHLSFQLVELKRKGGNKCPVDAEEPSDTTGDDYLCASVKLTYPQMHSDVNPELAEALNKMILQQLVDDAAIDDAEATPLTIEQFADSFIEDYKQDINQFNSWELERNIKVVFSTDKLLTLLFEEYGYTGGAHPFSGQRYAVLSLVDGTSIVLADLLSPGYEPPLNVMAEKAFRKSRELEDADSLEEHGFSFENNVFNLNKNFGVVKEGLDFIFNSYEIAPYAMGPSQFTVPYEDIHSLILPEGLLGNTAR